MKHPLGLLTISLLLVTGTRATEVAFANGGQFDNDKASDTAVFPDATITTLSLGGTATALNENSGTLGAVGEGGDNARWDQGETWTFEFNQNVNFHLIGFGVFGTSEDTATLQSDSWIGAGFTESDADLAFDNGSGTFTFSGGSNRDFDLSSLVTGNVILDVGEDVVFTALGTSNFNITSFGFSVVPEPGTYALSAGMCSLIFVMLKRRKD